MEVNLKPSTNCETDNQFITSPSTASDTCGASETGMGTKASSCTKALHSDLGRVSNQSYTNKLPDLDSGFG